MTAMNNNSQEILEETKYHKTEENAFEEFLTLKIVKIDKEYKKHNKKAITNAILNGTIILLFSWIIIDSNVNISNFGTEELSNLCNKIISYASFLPKSEILIAVYSCFFNGVNEIIDKLGLTGIILVSKSVKFILKGMKDTKKSLQIKEELYLLKEKIKEIKQQNAKTL